MNWAFVNKIIGKIFHFDRSSLGKSIVISLSLLVTFHKVAKTIITVFNFYGKTRIAFHLPHMCYIEVSAYTTPGAWGTVLFRSKEAKEDRREINLGRKPGCVWCTRSKGVWYKKLRNVCYLTVCSVGKSGIFPLSCSESTIREITHHCYLQTAVKQLLNSPTKQMMFVSESHGQG